MQLIFMRIIPTSGNRWSILGPVFRPFTDSDQHSFQKRLCHIDVPTFSWQNKVIKLCPKNLELIVSVLKADIVAQTKSITLVTNKKVAESLLFVRLF